MANKKLAVPKVSLHQHDILDDLCERPDMFFATKGRYASRASINFEGPYGREDGRRMKGLLARGLIKLGAFKKNGKAKVAATAKGKRARCSR